jgi:hypothetical protein
VSRTVQRKCSEATHLPSLGGIPGSLPSIRRHTRCRQADPSSTYRPHER